MEIIRVAYSKEGKNYCCGWGCPGFGAVLCTNKSLEEMKTEFDGCLRAQVADMVAEGAELPEWLASGAYKIEFSATDLAGQC